MSERTDEYRRIETIFGQCVAGGMIEFDDGSVTWQTAMIARLAKPLEAANAELARLRKLEADAKAAGFIGPDGQVLTVVCSGECGLWPSDDIMAADVRGTTVMWVRKPTAAEAARKEGDK